MPLYSYITTYETQQRRHKMKKLVILLLTVTVLVYMITNNETQDTQTAISQHHEQLSNI